MLGYRIYRDGTNIASLWFLENSYTDSGLAPSTRYVYTIEAYDSEGNTSGRSDELIAATKSSSLPPDTTPPTMPRNVVATTVSNSAIHLEWDASTDDSGKVHYAVWRGGPVYIGTTDNTSFDDTGLEPNGYYTYYIRAYDDSGNTTDWGVPVAQRTYPGDNSGPPSTVDVMIYYDTKLPEGATLVDHYVTITNQAYRDSGVNMQIRNVHMVPVDYPASKDNITALIDLIDAANVFSGMKEMREQYGADVVIFVRPFPEDQTSCGVSLVNGVSETQISGLNALSVVNEGPGCLDTTFAHELGHSMGLMHDRKWAEGPGIFSYSYGYCVADVAGDIMSYCGWSGVPLFSSPLLTANGVTLGVAIGEKEEADNASSLNNSRTALEQMYPAKQ